jgi:hypothetical protein
VITAGDTPGDGVVVVRYLDRVATARVSVPPERRFAASVYRWIPRRNEIDRLAYARFQQLGLLPSDPCSDSEFIRRATLDTLGVLPTAEEARAFLADPRPDKRDRLIDSLLSADNRARYADYWATKWGDLLRPNTQHVGVKPRFSAISASRPTSPSSSAGSSWAGVSTAPAATTTRPSAGARTTTMPSPPTSAR